MTKKVTKSICKRLILHATSLHSYLTEIHRYKYKRGLVLYWILPHMCRFSVSVPHTFYADPDPAILGNSDPGKK